MTYAVRREPQPRGHVIVISGEADVSAAEPLERALETAAAEGHKRLIVDLSDVDLVDSRTMGILARSSERLRGEGGGMSIACSNPHILRLFRLVGLEQMFDRYSTLAEAEAAASAQAPG